MDRRDFLKIAGVSAAAGFAPGCNRSEKAGKSGMTYRINPGNGDKISILGYGCMRWPVTKDENGKEIVDQEGANRLVDYGTWCELFRRRPDVPQRRLRTGYRHRTEQTSS